MEKNIEISQAELNAFYTLIKIVKKHNDSLSKIDLILDNKPIFEPTKTPTLILIKNEDDTWSNYITFKGQSFENKNFDSIIPALIRCAKILAESDEDYISIIREFLNSKELKKQEAKTYKRKRD